MKFNDLKRLALSDKKSIRIQKEKRSKWEWVKEIFWFPVEWIMKLTIPPCDPEHYDSTLTRLWPWFGILASMVIINKFKEFPTNENFWTAWLITSLCWDAIFFKVKGTIDYD